MQVQEGISGMTHLLPDFLRHGSPRIKRNNLLVHALPKPPRHGREDEWRVRVGEIRPPIRLELAHGDTQRAVDRIASGVSANRVADREIGLDAATDDGSAVTSVG